MAKLNIFGLLFDTKTGKVTYEDGEIPPGSDSLTFEYHEGYNPLQYATDAAGEKIVDVLKFSLPTDIKYTLYHTGVIGPIHPPPQLLVGVDRNGISAEFNVGLIANSLIRSGSLASFKAELKSAGILF